MKKAFSIILSLILLYSCCGILACAAYEDSLIVYDYIEDSWIVDITGNKVSSNEPSYMYLYDTDTYILGHKCYDYLDSAQKYVYDAIVANVGKLSFTIEFPNNLFAYSNFNKAYLTAIMDAVCTDRPDVFYYAGYGVSGGSLYSGGTYMKTMNYEVSVYDSSYYTDSNLPGYYSALISKVPNVPVDLSNRYNFIKSAHDYLADTVYYPDLTTSDYKMSAHDAYGALVEGRAVCQGYSDAFKLICDYYRIPCVCISGVTDTGGGHMWNAIQMDDGKWYLMDITWDDQDSWLFYDFFLVGTQSTNTYFGGKQFSVEHVNDADIPMPLPRLDYASSAYNGSQNHNTLFGATYNSYADFDENYLYLSAFDAGKSNVYYNGIYVPVNDFSNNETFTVPSGTNSADEAWSLVLVGDLNSDDVCDSLDYSAAINLLCTDDYEINTTAERACDVNQDGVIDVLDVAVIARASSGLNTDIILE